jgi:spore maturation protein CgeB
MLKKIDVLLPRISQYKALHHFAYKIYEAFQRAGASTRLLEVSSQKEPSLAHEQPDLTVGFNGAPHDSHNRLYCDLHHISHLSLLVDPPYRFLYLTESPYTIVGCDDRICCKFLESLRFDRNLFIPHAVEPELNAASQEKIFDVTLLATFIDIDELKKSWKTKFSPSMRHAMEDAIEITFSDPYTSFITAFLTALGVAQDQLSTLLFENDLIDALQDVELYVKGRNRIELALSVPHSTLHIFGGKSHQLDWKGYLGKKYPNIYVHTPVDYIEALEIMKKSKVVLNPSLKNKEGAHERLFVALACEALVVSNESSYLRESFKDKEGIVFFTPDKMDFIDQSIAEYLQHMDRREEEVKKGRDIVMQKHTWDHRVKSILAKVPNFFLKIGG